MQRILLILSTVILFMMTAFGQSIPQKERRVYLLDVTASMKGVGDVGAENIFAQVKQKLGAAISNVKKADSEIIVIPFTDRAFAPLRGLSANADSLVGLIDCLEIRRGETDINTAWKRGVEEMDSSRINYMFLLTDGIHNAGMPKEQLYETLKSWETISDNKYYFAFYVMLTPLARENRIKEIVDSVPQMWSIESMDVNTSFVTLPLRGRVNINKSKKVKYTFPKLTEYSEQDSKSIRMIVPKSEYYSITDFKCSLSDGEISFMVNEIQDHVNVPLKYEMQLKFLYDREKYPLLFFVPDNLHLTIENLGVRSMIIKQIK